MEQQTKAALTCCTSVFQLIILCCIVGKLQAASDGESGYNAFIILVPVFCLVGILLCCCSCLIYSATPDSINIISERTKRDSEGTAGADENVKDGDKQSMINTALPERETNPLEEKTAEQTHIIGDVINVAGGDVDLERLGPTQPVADASQATMDDLD
jgi:hypothetical protein